MRISRSFSVIDSHTAGHPTRLIVSGIPPLQGKSVREKRDYFRKHYDFLRPQLLHEPHGHSATVGAILTESSVADIGVFYISSYVYLDMCGHGTIGTVKTLAATGAIPPDLLDRNIRIETPAGIVVASVRRSGDEVVDVSFANVDSFLLAPTLAIDVPKVGIVNADISYGGCWYALVDAGQLDLDLSQRNIQATCELGESIKAAATATLQTHPGWSGEDYLNAVVFYRTLADRDQQVAVLTRQKFDRSPCGTGCSARLAELVSRGAMKVGDTRTFESIVGGTFEGRVDSIGHEGGRMVVRSTITGTAHITAMSTLLVEESDPLAAGFLFG
jgi:proline racemase